jgi:hypothetical protein
MAEPQVRYAKKDIYAEVPEEGGNINRLIAAQGQPIPPAYVDLVDEADTTTDVNVAHDIARGRTSSARRARAGQSQEGELPHEEFRDVAAASGGQTQEEPAAKTSRRSGSAKGAGK